MPVRNNPRDLFYSSCIERKLEAQGSFSCIIFSFGPFLHRAIVLKYDHSAGRRCYAPFPMLYTTV
jgi:hypothetical protein